MNVLALCAGIGGLELGLHLAEPGSRPVVFIEQDAFCRGVLAARWPGVPIWDNLLTFDPEPWAGQIDVVTAGFPCQPWSVAGKRKGTGDERWIWPGIEAIIRAIGPGYVFLENTPGLISGGGLALVLKSLAESRYHAVWGVYSCQALGAAHIRKRVLILAMDHSLCQLPMEYPYGLRRPGDWLPDSGHSKVEGPSQGMALADSDRPRLPQREEQHHQKLSALERSGREIWAPGRDADWREISPDLWPSEQPLCGVVNGFPRWLEPDRTSRIRALGNAVSPPVSAAGWIDLKHRLMMAITQCTP